MTKVSPAYDRNVDTAAEEASAYEQQVNEDVGGASEKRLAELMGVDTKLIDAAVLKLVAFRCSKVRTMDPRLYGAPAWADGLRWVALSGPEAAKGLTRMLQTPVSQHQAKRALDRVSARGLLRREKHRFNNHGTCWYRLDAVAVGKLLDPEGEGAEIRELVRRPRGDRVAGAGQLRGACAPTARLVQVEPLAVSPEPSALSLGCAVVATSAKNTEVADGVIPEARSVRSEGKDQGVAKAKAVPWACERCAAAPADWLAALAVQWPGFASSLNNLRLVLHDKEGPRRHRSITHALLCIAGAAVERSAEHHNAEPGCWLPPEAAWFVEGVTDTLLTKLADPDEPVRSPADMAVGIAKTNLHGWYDPAARDDLPHVSELLRLAVATGAGESA